MAIETYSVEDIPRFRGAIPNIVRQSVEWLGGSTDLVCLTPDVMESEYGYLNHFEMIREGRVSHLGSCLYACTGLLPVLNKSGVDPKLVVEKVRRKGTSFDGLHFALEVGNDGDVHTIDPHIFEEVVLSRGKYVSHNPDFEHFGEERFPGDKFDPNKTLLNFLKYDESADVFELGSDLLKGLELRPILQGLVGAITYQGEKIYNGRFGLHSTHKPKFTLVNKC